MRIVPPVPLSLALLLLAAPAFPQPLDDLLAPGPSGLPVVSANDNRSAAGALRGGVRIVDLEVVRADWRPEADDGPGLRVAAVAERGRAPRIPGPLLRAPVGARFRVRVRNRLDAPVTVHGLGTRGGGEAAPFTIRPRGDTVVEFAAGAPGTYLYWIREGDAPAPGAPSLELMQAAGALVVDPPGIAPEERILVLNVFSRRQVGLPRREAMTVNGRSWPHTERFSHAVGDSVRWRVVNATDRGHPMHLHGFYFTVAARGSAWSDTAYAEPERRLVVTETLPPRSTMRMEWSPTRPGSWLFHCHLSFHVASRLRLPNPGHEDAHGHMAGLVVGIEVEPGPTDIVTEGEPQQVALYANEYGAEKGFRFGFAAIGDFEADSLTDAPGPVLVFHQRTSADVTVFNRTTVPTSVHWHGLELDAWSDGVPEYSASEGRMSPAIAPGGSFTYRLSFLRPGTFIYHSHLDDVNQLVGGLYGALLVLPPGVARDERTDHVYVLGWNTKDAEGLDDADLNGRRVQPTRHAAVGELHRFRVINIAPAGDISAWLTLDAAPIPITLLAKDGADLPEVQRRRVERLPWMGVGETADFTWTPDAPGSYLLHIGYGDDANLVQRWEVAAAPVAAAPVAAAPAR
jgi:manganese oxidase